MSELLDGWTRDQRRRGLMPSTIARRGAMIASFGRWLDGTPIDEVTAEDIEVFLDTRRTHLGEPISSRTRCTWLSCLSCFAKWAIRHHHLDVNPVDEIERPKLRRTLPRPIADDDLSTALAAATGQINRWLLLAAYAGLRCAEIAGLERDDLLHDIGMIRVVGKGGKERLVPMHGLVIEALRSWPMPRTNGVIFRRPNGDRWPDALLSREGSVFFHDLGIDATLHQLRHWFGTRALRACRDLRVVQELMGHANPATTAIYTAFCNEDGRAAVNSLTLGPATTATTAPTQAGRAA